MRHDVRPDSRHPSDEFEVTDDSDTQSRARPAGFGHRHGLKVLGAIMATMFVAVLVVQVAC